MVRYKWSRGKGNKKYSVEIFIKGNLLKKVSFGDKRYQQYRDSTPLKLYSNKDHLDKKRRALYFKRHKKDYGKWSADWFSKKYLW